MKIGPVYFEVLFSNLENWESKLLAGRVRGSSSVVRRSSRQLTTDNGHH